MVQELSKRDESFLNIVNEARKLDRLYVAPRYPNGLPGGSPFQVYSVDDLAEAYEDVTKVCKLCTEFLRRLNIR
jgi:HEPN domain-containing protein